MTIVENNINSHEECIRCLIHPRCFSNGKHKIKRDAFFPPPGCNDVSLLRLEYTDISFCRKHGKHLSKPGNAYVGLSSVTQAIIDKCLAEYRKENVEKPISAVIVFAPMLNDSDYADKNKIIYKEDGGLPMHADLHYNISGLSDNDGLQSRIRNFANILIKKIKYIEDQGLPQGTWTNCDAFDDANA